MKYPAARIILDNGKPYDAPMVLLMVRNGQVVAFNPAYTDPFDAMPREYIMEGEPRIHPHDGRILFDNGFINDGGEIYYGEITDTWREYAVERSGSEDKELTSEDYLFKSRFKSSPHISTRQYARIVNHKQRHAKIS